MRWRRPVLTRGGRTLGISFLILSMVHAPLPEPDYHNIRHHDGAGEVCEHHDHLLRWHPGAGVASDVAILHWHWFLPTDPGTDPVPEGQGAAVHAHVPAWQSASWEDGPQLAPDNTSELAARPAPCPLERAFTADTQAVLGALTASGTHPPPGFGASFMPRVSLTSLLHRWVC
jgi:hypothetical protein